MDNTIQFLLDTATRQLKQSGSPRLDAEILLQDVLQCERSYFYSHPEARVPDNKVQQFHALLEQRLEGVPIAYLLGEKEFWSLSLKVNKDTLIPRPETELLVEQALQWLPVNEMANVIDLGTGSGAIALIIARERPKANVIATDISEQALKLARLNAQKHGMSNIQFIQSNWFDNITDDILFDLIVSNPPYIAENDPHLKQGDVRFEPDNALVSGTEGLDDLQWLISHSHLYLKENGYLLLEHGYTQGKTVMQMLEQQAYGNIKPLYDLSGHHRASYAVNLKRI